jgi:hypothetical protein
MRVCVLVDDDATDLCPNSSPFVTRFGAWGVVLVRSGGSSCAAASMAAACVEEKEEGEEA